MPYIQLDAFESARARDEGMKVAVEHADRVEITWSARAFEFLNSPFFRVYTRSKPFMVEDIRAAAQELIPAPPSQRSWGAVIVRAYKAGLVEKCGYQTVKNVKAHSTPASLWRFV